MSGPSRQAIGSWLLTIAFAGTWLSGFLSRRVEGRVTTPDELAVAGLVLLSVGVSVVLTFRWALTRGTATNGDGTGGASADRAGPPPRRRFLLALLGLGGAAGGVAATLAAALLPNRRWVTVTGRNIFLVKPPYKADVARDEWIGSRVQGYRRLGRTEALVSDISLGSGSSTGGRQTLDVAREAIERGINYFDTAPDYSEAGSEERLGEAMKGRRDEMFVATKFCLPRGHLGPGTPVEGYMRAVEGSLRRLQTDRVDLIHVHSCDTVERLMDPNVHEAFDRLKEQGKVRFLGVSTHTPNLEAVADAAIESDRFDVMMLAYHFGAWPGLESILARAAAKDIGVVGMKVLRGSQHHFLDWPPDDRDSFTQASFRWVLSNPHVSCLVISLWERAQLDEFLFASGQRPGRAPGQGVPERDLAVLERYTALTTRSYCRPHCGACLDQCSEGLPIHDILRQRMYFEHFGAEKEAMRLYAALPKQADRCLGCAAPCATACPYGLDIPERMRGAHERLGIA